LFRTKFPGLYLQRKISVVNWERIKSDCQQSINRKLDWTKKKRKGLYEQKERKKERKKEGRKENSVIM